jgi:hypothetical protein
MLVIISGKMLGQSYADQRSVVLATNLICNAVIGGVGGMIHKKPEEKRWQAFGRNFIRGTAGGLIKYSAKYQTYYFNQANSHFYAPLNRLYFFLGHSIVMNAAYNKKMLQTFHANFLGVDLRMDLSEEEKLKARISLATLVSAVAFASRGYELNLYRSLEMGVLYFDVRRKLPPGAGESAFNCLAIGVPPPSKNFISNPAWPHEVVHTFQMYDLSPVAAFYDKWLTKKTETKKWIKTAGKYFVTDYEVLFFTAGYLLMPQPRYYRNYFEFEAEHFTRRAYLDRRN